MADAETSSSSSAVDGVEEIADTEYIRRKIACIVSLLTNYTTLVDAYVSDFYVSRIWETIPESWWHTICDLSPPQLASLLSLDTWSSRQVWPLSLLAFRTAVHTLALPRQPTQPVSPPPSISSPERTSTTLHHGQYLPLEHCYRRHVKPKKQHEILSLGKVIQQACASSDLRHVVDVGAGQGHLSRLLAFGYGLQVTTVEASSCHAPKASKFDSEVKNDLLRGPTQKKKKKAKVKEKDEMDEIISTIADNAGFKVVHQPQHIVGTIDASISVEEFLGTLNSVQDDPCNKFSSENLSEETSACLTSGRGNASFGCTVNTHANQEHNHQTFTSLHFRNPVNQNDFVCDEKYLNNIVLNKDNSNNSTFMQISNSGNASRELLNCHNHKQCPQVAPHSPLTDNEAKAHSAFDKQIQKMDHSKLSSFNNCSDSVSAGMHHNQKDTQCDRIQLDQSSENGHSSVSPFLLTGLHACGDLTATLLRVFVNCPLVAGLASVGCCYMKLSTEQNIAKDAEIGYPMSQYVASLPGHQLSWEAREMACHFMDNYHDRLLENPISLRAHVYRSALQEIIHRKDPTIIHGSVKLTQKKTHELPFAEYAARALTRLGLDPSPTEEDLTRAELRLANWKEVVAFYSLRLSLGPMIETLILLDRVLYLIENGVKCELVPVFNPKLSPRNFVLLAHKQVF